MANPKIVSAIRESRFFGNLDEDMLNELASVARPRVFGARETVFNEGDPCEGFYLLMEGAAKVYKLSADGKEHVLYLAWAGETFAEAAMFSGDTYPAYVEAIKPSKVLLFPKDAVLDLLRRRPEVSMRLLAGMAVWLRRLVSQVEVLALHDSSSRLAQFLKDRGDGDVVVLQAPKAVVASHLGMTPETLSRLFFRLEGLGVIHVEGRRIRILDAEMLQSIAEGQETA